MPDPALLETFPTPTGVADSAPIVIEHIAEEFTSQCPKTGHPDFGTVTLRYEPAPAPPNTASLSTASTPTGKGKGGMGGGCVELKSLKLYYQSFRNEGIFYEAVTHRIRDDLVRAMAPVWLQVITSWRGRGGIRSVIRADFGNVPPHFRGT